MPQADTAPAHATIVAVRGAVVDVAFPCGPLPRIDDALRIEWDRPGELLAEVQSHLDEHTVRAIASQATAGLARGTGVSATNAAISVPAGATVLGRPLDVTGETRDGGIKFPADTPRWPAPRASFESVAGSEPRARCSAGL